MPAQPSPFVRYRRLRRAASGLKGPERQRAIRQSQRERRDAMEAASDRLLRAWFAAPDPRSEDLLWFWFNHFNVYWHKDAVGVLLDDYLERALRPHADGRFRELLQAATLHPAMLVYLDNEKNAAGRLNENHARELLELHTVGVQGGYGQRDVQELARVMTGFGLVTVEGLDAQAAVAGGDFRFDPRRHDGGAKSVLGLALAGAGPEELGAVFDALAAHPATARHLARKLALFLIGDAAPETVVDAAVQAWQDSGGTLGAVVQALREHPELRERPPASFKDPRHWLLSALRRLANGAPLRDTAPLQRWLLALGQPLFGRRTPDGYSLRGSDWLGAGQLTQRFELARELVAALPRLLDAAPEPAALFERLAGEPPFAGARSRATWARATTPTERLALMLSSPEFMHWSPT